MYHCFLFYSLIIIYCFGKFLENVGSFKLEAADKAGGDSRKAGCAAAGIVNFNVNAAETKTVTLDAGCTGKYLVVKPYENIKLTLCRVRVYGTCSSMCQI